MDEGQWMLGLRVMVAGLLSAGIVIGLALATVWRLVRRVLGG